MTWASLSCDFSRNNAWIAASQLTVLKKINISYLTIPFGSEKDLFFHIRKSELDFYLIELLLKIKSVDFIKCFSDTYGDDNLIFTLDPLMMNFIIDYLFLKI